MDVWEIAKLEKKYMSKINDILNRDDFIDNLHQIENIMSDPDIYKKIRRTWGKENVIALSAERLVYEFMFFHLGYNSTNPNPISADVSFYTQDALINIDVKTTDFIGNSADVKALGTPSGINQISFNEDYMPQELKKTNFPGYFVEGRLDSLTIPNNSNKIFPTLTYVVNIFFIDGNKENKIKFNHIDILCIPNQKVKKEFFSDVKIIDNFKTYDYLKEDNAKSMGLGPKYYPRIKDCEPKGDRIGSIIIDSNIKHPDFTDRPVTWKLMDNNKYWQIRLGGSSPRINKYKLKHRKFLNDNWYGWVQIIIAKNLNIFDIFKESIDAENRRSRNSIVYEYFHRPETCDGKSRKCACQKI